MANHPEPLMASKYLVAFFRIGPGNVQKWRDEAWGTDRGLWESAGGRRGDAAHRSAVDRPRSVHEPPATAAEMDDPPRRRVGEVHECLKDLRPEVGDYKATLLAALAARWRPWRSAGGPLGGPGGPAWTFGGPGGPGGPGGLLAASLAALAASGGPPVAALAALAALAAVRRTALVSGSWISVVRCYQQRLPSGVRSCCASRRPSDVVAAALVRVLGDLRPHPVIPEWK
eukprot:gene9241-biopygen8458